MKVEGKNVVVFIQSGSDWIPYLCARSASLNIETEFIETSVSGTGTYATFLPTKTSFTGSLNGVVSMSEPDVFDLISLRQKQIAQEMLLMRFQRTDEGGNVYYDECNFYISSSSDTGSFDDMNVFSIELRGTGAITTLYTPAEITGLQWWVVSVGTNDTVYFYGAPATGDLITATLTATNADTESPDYTALADDGSFEVREGLLAAVNAGTLFSATSFVTTAPTFGVTGVPAGATLYALTIHNEADFGVTTVITVT